MTRVSSANVLDEGLRIKGKGRRMNSKVKTSDKQGETWCLFENKLVINWLNLNLSLASLT
jgi:hypothetical protein